MLLHLKLGVRGQQKRIDLPVSGGIENYAD